MGDLNLYRLFPDTHPRVEALQIELLRARHPDEPPERIKRRLADILLGEALSDI